MMALSELTLNVESALDLHLASILDQHLIQVQHIYGLATRPQIHIRLANHPQTGNRLSLISYQCLTD